jgi:hypothetical protein
MPGFVSKKNIQVAPVCMCGLVNTASGSLTFKDYEGVIPIQFGNSAGGGYQEEFKPNWIPCTRITQLASAKFNTSVQYSC